jgi:hypothetical protein
MLAKAKNDGFKRLLLGKEKIPRTDEDYDKELEEGKNLRIATGMNELTCTELFLLMKRKAVEKSHLI